VEIPDVALFKIGNGKQVSGEWGRYRKRTQFAPGRIGVMEGDTEPQILETFSVSAI